jgi:hypothetical protein
MHQVPAFHEPLAAVLAAERDLLVGIAPLVIGLVVVIGLIAAVAVGMRLRDSGELRPSTPGKKGPDEPTEYETRHRVPDEVPHDGRRRMPYDLHDYDSDSHPGEHEGPRPKWDPGSSGSFGSGGLGHH